MNIFKLFKVKGEFMKKILIALAMVPNLVFAQAARHSEIQSWVEVVAQKGYILSVDLHYEKMCSKIWTQQLKDFKKMNPHIKDPNLILVNQKIKVQDCRVVVKEVEAPVMIEAKKEEIKKPEWFISAFAGASSLGGKDNDTAKTGYNFGVKAGRHFDVKNKKLAVAIGYLQNNSKTNDGNNSLGVYEVRTDMITLDASLLSSLSDKWQLGPKALAVFSKDVSLKDNQNGEAAGLYVGGEALYKIKDKLKLSLDIQQRLDDLSRLNLMGNVGLKFDF